MRILVLDVAASTTGALAILEDFINFVKKAYTQHEWYFVVSEEKLKCENKDINVIVEKFPKKNWINRIIWEFLLVQKVIKNTNPDIIFSLQNTSVMFTRLPQVVYIHQSLPFYKERKWSYYKKSEISLAVYRDLFGFLIGKSVKTSKKVIVQTDWMKEVVAKTYNIPYGKIETIPPSVSFNQETSNSNTYIKSNEFFYPASPSLYKNFEVVIEAVKYVVKMGYEIVVYFTFKGSENSYAEALRRLSEEHIGNIKFIGHISRENVFEMYKSCNLIFPSLLETFGLPLLEARSVGTSILVSDRPFAHEVLEGYKNTIFFDPHSAVDLAEKMITVIKNTRNSEDKDIDTSYLNKYSSENTWGKVVKVIEQTANNCV